MATSSRVPGRPVAAAALAAVAAGAAVVAALLPGSGRAHAAIPVPAPATQLAALHAVRPPERWRHVALASAGAMLAFPAGWRPLAGDAGTISEALSERGRYLAYLNLTPRPRPEPLAGWPENRLAHLREEGDRGVRELAARSGIAFAGASGACLLDEYTAAGSSNRYRELACLVRGRRHEDVLVAAAPAAGGPALGATLTRAAEALAVS